MTKIKFHSADLTELATLNAALSASRTERLNSNNVLNFACRVKDSASVFLNENTICSLDGDYYDVAFFRSIQQGNGQLLYDVQCEHVSYRLNNPEFNVEYFTMTGTPEAVLGAILADTGFTVGTVEFSTVITISLQEAASRRGLLMYLVLQLGGDLVCNGFEISIVEHRGTATPKPLTVGKNVTVVSKSVNKRSRDSQGNPIVSYACEVYKGTALALGDVVSLDYDILGIDATLRVMEISYDPYNPATVSIEVGNLSSRLEDDIYRIETETVAKNKTYYGTRIGPDNGFETIRNDKKARSVMNADMLAWQIGDGSGSNWESMLFYDAASNKIKFTGDINMVSGSISWGPSGVPRDPTIATAQSTADGASSAASSAQSAIDAIKTNLGYTYIDGQYVISPKIIGGSITSSTTIDVGTDARVGNNLYLGTLDSLESKMIKFNGGVNLHTADAGGLGVGNMKRLVISALELELVNVTQGLKGAWDFSGATVTLPSSISIPAVFS